MSRPIMLSLNPQWFEKIMTGEKTREVRKRVPMQKGPYKVYLYCTKAGETIYRAGVKGKIKPYLMNGTVCGEFTCVTTIDYTPPWSGHVLGTCLTAPELYAYAAGAEKLSYMVIEDPVLYDKPKSLADFGLKYAPQSWQYLEEEEE